MNFFKKRKSGPKSEKLNCVENYCVAEDCGCQSYEPCAEENCGCHPTCSCPAPETPAFSAQYGTTSNPPSGTNLPIYPVFNLGNQISLADDYTIVLPAGYLYLISYLFLATTEAGGYMEIVPFLNETPRLLYSSFAPAGNARNTSASGSFTTNEAAEGELRVQFRLTYPETVRNIDISGAVSVTPLQRL